ncbi:MAG: TonB-dependent receptor plug domain-containing protein, partial [Bacteroidota bacterium]
AASNVDGFFTVRNVEPGQYTFQVSFIGFQSYEERVHLDRGETLLRGVVLEVDEQLLGELTVEGTLSLSTRIVAGTQILGPADLMRIPSPEVSSDLLNYLAGLPGVVSRGDRGGQLFIRGGEPTQNLVLLDGILLYQPFHIIGFYSAIPGDIVHHADVHAGGFGAEYGERLSSVLNIGTRAGNKQRFEGAVGVSPFMSSIRVEGPILQDRISALASVRQSLVEQVAGPAIGQDLPFTFFDSFAKVHTWLDDTSQLSLSGVYAHDEGRVQQIPGGKPQEEMAWTNGGVGARYVILHPYYPVQGEAQIAHSWMDARLGPAVGPTRESAVTNTRFSTRGTFYGTNADVEAGFRMSATSYNNQLGGDFQNVLASEDYTTQFGVYVQPEFRVGRAVAIRPGIALQYYEKKPFPTIEPRLRIVLGDSVQQFTVAGGRYHQELIGINDKRDAASVFTAWTLAPDNQVPEAWHGIVGFNRQLGSGLGLSTEGFYKSLRNIGFPEWTPFPTFSTQIQPTDGEAYGLDLRLEVQRAQFYGYINYGWANVTYTFVGPQAEQSAGSVDVSFRPPHDRRHQLSAGLSYAFGNVHTRLRWHFGSGLPFNQARGFDVALPVEGVFDVMGEPGQRRALYDGPLAGELPTYHRLDVSVGYDWSMSWAEVRTQAALINTYDRSNIFFVDIFTLSQVDQLPLVPTLGLEVAFR